MRTFPSRGLPGPAAEEPAVIVGWRRTGPGTVELIACDDSVGPYEVIGDPLDHGDDWQALMIRLPEKIFLSGAAAEAHALRLLDAEAARARIGGGQSFDVVLVGIELGRLMRTDEGGGLVQQPSPAGGPGRALLGLASERRGAGL